MRSIDQISQEIKEAEAKASDPDLRGSGIYSAEQQRKLYQARAEALRAELEVAESARLAILRMARNSPIA